MAMNIEKNLTYLRRIFLLDELVDTMTRRLDTMASSLLLIRWRWRRCNDAAGAADRRQRWRSSSCGMAETKAAGVSGGWAEAFRLL